MHDSRVAKLLNYCISTHWCDLLPSISNLKIHTDLSTPLSSLNFQIKISNSDTNLTRNRKRKRQPYILLTYTKIDSELLDFPDMSNKKNKN